MVIKDGVKVFLDHFNISESSFIDFGLDNIIFADKISAVGGWRALLRIIKENKETLYVRRFGSISIRQSELLSFYKSVLGVDHIDWDKTNNFEANKFFSVTTNVLEKKKLTNYRLSHIWGKTKNPYAYCASWNLCYTPVFIDPFTGHETKGTLSKKFANELKVKAISRFLTSILEFNKIMGDLSPTIDKYLVQLENKKNYSIKDRIEISKVIKNNFSIIEINI